MRPPVEVPPSYIYPPATFLALEKGASRCLKSILTSKKPSRLQRTWGVRGLRIEGVEGLQGLGFRGVWLRLSDGARVAWEVLFHVAHLWSSRRTFRIHPIHSPQIPRVLEWLWVESTMLVVDFPCLGSLRGLFIWAVLRMINVHIHILEKYYGDDCRGFLKFCKAKRARSPYNPE